MEGLLRKYKISKISDNFKLTERELEICEFLDKIFVGLERHTTNINLVYYTNCDNYWIFDTNYNEDYAYVNSYLIQPFFHKLNIIIFTEIEQIILDWLDSLYNIRKLKNDIKLSWSLMPDELKELGIKEYPETYHQDQ